MKPSPFDRPPSAESTGPANHPGDRSRRRLIGSTAITLAACVGALSRAQVTAPASPAASKADVVRQLPDAMPAAILSQMISGRKLVGMPGLTWNRKVLTVAFDGGSDVLYELLEQTAQEWTSHGGAMKFSFRVKNGQFRHWSPQDTAPAAAVRVSFRTDEGHNGYWSAVGRMAENVDANQPTMNLDGFPEKLLRYFNGRNPTAWRSSYEHSVVLHEFGHALGLAHEHFHPECQADLRLAKAMAWLMKSPNNWTYDVARFNMDAPFYFSVTADIAKTLNSHPVFSTHIDQGSVMLYSFLDEFYKSGAKSPCKPAVPLGYATSLSKSDIQFYLDKYTHIQSPF